MKITKEKLKQIILEEAGKMASGAVAQHSVDQTKAMRQGGIDDNERAAIATVSQKLAAAAKKGNILSGPLARRLEQLVAEIDKALGSTEQGDSE